MPRSLEPFFSNEFALDLADVDEISRKRGAHIRTVVRQLQAFPNMGNPNPRKALRDRYGDDIRTMVVDGYMLVYRHDDEALWLIALPWGSSVR